MILRFATHADAAIHAGMMRSMGHYAAILDENMGFMWGPLVVGGFRVIVSDEPISEEAAEENQVAGDAPQSPGVFDELRTVIVAIVTVAMVFLLLTVIKYLAYDPAYLLAIIVPCVFLLAVNLCLVPLAIRMTRALRDEQSVFGNCLRGLVILHVTVQLLFPYAVLIYTMIRQS